MLTYPITESLVFSNTEEKSNFKEANVDRYLFGMLKANLTYTPKILTYPKGMLEKFNKN